MFDMTQLKIEFWITTTVSSVVHTFSWKR